jgi:hypothetical protein
MSTSPSLASASPSNPAVSANASMLLCKDEHQRHAKDGAGVAE